MASSKLDQASSRMDDLLRRMDAWSPEARKASAAARKYSVVKEGGRAPSYHVVHNETKLIHHHGEPTFSGAQAHRKGIEENHPKFGPVEPKKRWNGSKAVLA